MLKASMLVLALTVSFVTTTTATFAAAKRSPADSYNSTITQQSDDDLLFDRAKGNTDW